VKTHPLAAHDSASVDLETNGLLRSLFRDLDISLAPFEFAIASGDRLKATALQAHIELICAAMLVLYDKKQLAAARAKNLISSHLNLSLAPHSSIYFDPDRRW
jgi:hypothetical protein